MSLSTTQLDKLGQRLKEDGPPSDDDLRMLDEYRRSFEDASATVNQVLRSEFDLQPTARPAKSTRTIVDKLRRQQTQLTRIQDIAGCRVIVRTLGEQKGLIAKLKAKFSKAKLFDRVESPSHGYRAQHRSSRSITGLLKFRSGRSCSICGPRCLRRWQTDTGMKSSTAPGERTGE